MSFINSMRKRLLMIVLDGASDLPIKELKDKTCLEAANKPGLNFIASQSTTGLMDVISKGIAPQSDAATFSILGYDPLKYYVSRGVLEAFGAGLKLEDGELVLRANLASVKRDQLMNVRVSGIKYGDSLRIERLINEQVSLDVPFTFELTRDYRGVLIFHDKTLSDQVSNTHPGYSRQAKKGFFLSKARIFKQGAAVKECRALNPKAKRTAELINNFIIQSHKVLNRSSFKDKFGNRVNYLLMRDAGNRLPLFPSFYSKFKLSMAMIADMPSELGIAKMLNLEVVKAGDDLRDVYASALDKLDENDGVYVHLKGPDKYAHLMDVKGKVKTIESIDKDFVQPLLAAIDLSKTTICVTCDHSTPVKHGVHSADPVPLMITGKSDGTAEFNEKACAKGKLGRITGRELMPKLIKII